MIYRTVGGLSTHNRKTLLLEIANINCQYTHSTYYIVYLRGYLTFIYMCMTTYTHKSVCLWPCSLSFRLSMCIMFKIGLPVVELNVNSLYFTVRTIDQINIGLDVVIYNAARWRGEEPEGQLVLFHLFLAFQSRFAFLFILL